MRRSITTTMTMTTSRGAARLAFIVAAARVRGLTVSDSFAAHLDEVPVPWQELEDPAHGITHLVDLPESTHADGRLTVTYRATVDGDPSSAVDASPGATELDRLRYLRPSRYAESDHLAGTAHSEFGSLEGFELLDAVATWVHDHIAYMPGTSRPTDGAVETFLARAGVCRDFAHLVVALLRALDVPARLVSVYAPGLSPMDFHAVAEAWVDGTWHVVDATRLAPRQSLVRIATGRDAADTAFLSAYGAPARFERLNVIAVVDGALPVDDVSAPARLP